MIEFGAATHVGRVRNNNEDCYHVDERRGIVVVADGMGGHVAGEIASAVAVEATVDVLDRNGDATAVSLLGDAVERAHAAVVAAAEVPGRRGMGTTLDVLLFRSEGVFFAHVGDGRVYLVGESIGGIFRATRDHVVEGPLRRSALSQSVGVGAAPRPQIGFVGCWRGDVVLACTDGLHGHVPDPEIREILLTRGTSRAAANALVDAALAAGGTDNVTCVVARIG